MKLARPVVVLTCLVVAGLGVWFSIARWDDANRVATVLSALGAVAAVGIAVWTALRTSAPSDTVRVANTGHARSQNGDANTGARLRRHTSSSVEVTGTGDATATGGGSSNTGFHQE